MFDPAPAVAHAVEAPPASPPAQIEPAAAPRGRAEPAPAPFARAPRRMPWWAPVAGVALAATVGGGLMLAQPKPPPIAARAGAAAITPPAPVEHALVGDWAGNGAACWSNPLRIAVDGSTLKETLSSTPSVGAITGREGDHAVRVKFPGDANVSGDQVYAVAGDTLTLTISGSAMTYKRCKS